MSGDVDPQKLDPGIRRTVMLLRSWGYNTVDSGDGVTKRAAGWAEDEASDTPHVFIQVKEAKDLITWSHLLERDLHTRLGIELAPDGVMVQANYSPHDRTALLMLIGLHDGMLPAEGAS